MKATWNGVTIAESDDTVVVEGNHYFPESSLKREYVSFSNHRSSCAWKGQAHYYSLLVERRREPERGLVLPRAERRRRRRDQGAGGVLERGEGRGLRWHGSTSSGQARHPGEAGIHDPPARVDPGFAGMTCLGPTPRRQPRALLDRALRIQLAASSAPPIRCVGIPAARSGSSSSRSGSWPAHSTTVSHSITGRRCACRRR
jgi:hypothetical protein